MFHFFNVFSKNFFFKLEDILFVPCAASKNCNPKNYPWILFLPPARRTCLSFIWWTASFYSQYFAFGPLFLSVQMSDDVFSGLINTFLFQIMCQASSPPRVSQMQTRSEDTRCDTVVTLALDQCSSDPAHLTNDL